MLPVPDSVRTMEREAEAKHKAKLDELRAAGFNLAELPADELQAAGDGEEGAVMKEMLPWVRTLKRYRDGGQPDRADALESLRQKLLAWRCEEAVRLHIEADQTAHGAARLQLFALAI